MANNDVAAIRSFMISILVVVRQARQPVRR
jgi:hypothetical protein